MSALFEELGFSKTSIGELSLRRRKNLYGGDDIYEIKLGDEYLMSSMFTESEHQLGKMGMETVEGELLDVVVGGLGLGYTAHAVLEDLRVNELIVVDMLDAVIDWHKNGLLPLSRELCNDRRCRFVSGNFFAMAESPEGFDPEDPHRLFDAVILDIDHSPEEFLDPDNAGFYTSEGLNNMMQKIKPGGVFALWSNNPPDPRFTKHLADVFAAASAEEIRFFNPLQNNDAVQSIYIAKKANK
ncbi:spermine/spermidine synthase domain-containing protein [Spirochaeta dissipatitropha]